MTKISVIIPIYNMGQYLEECLDSVLAQTLTDIEIICVNDGSTDNSLDILQKYAKRSDKIILLDQQNSGVGQSRNNGISIARGEFVAFMDPDDLYPENDVLEYLYKCANENKVNICGGSFDHIRDGEVFIKKEYIFTSDCIMDFREYSYLYGFWRFIYNLEFLKKNNLIFPSYGRCQDLPFLVNAMVCSGKFYAVRKITYRYRVGHKRLNLSAQTTVEYAKGIVDLLKITKENNMKKYHALTVKSLQMDLRKAIYKHIASGYYDLHEMVYKINKAIDIKLLQEEDYKDASPFLLEPSEIPNFVKKVLDNEMQFVNTLLKYKNIVIYGAGHVGKMVAEYIQSINEIQVICFAVSPGTENPSSINGVPIQVITELTSYNKNVLVLIATFDKLHNEIKNTLEDLQFKNILPIHYNEFIFFEVKTK